MEMNNDDKHVAWRHGSYFSWQKDVAFITCNLFNLQVFYMAIKFKVLETI